MRAELNCYPGRRVSVSVLPPGFLQRKSVRQFLRWHVICKLLSRWSVAWYTGSLKIQEEKDRRVRRNRFSSWNFRKFRFARAPGLSTHSVFYDNSWERMASLHIQFFMTIHESAWLLYTFSFLWQFMRAHGLSTHSVFYDNSWERMASLHIQFSMTIQWERMASLHM
jgi:hypothetical protein